MLRQNDSFYTKAAITKYTIAMKAVASRNGRYRRRFPYRPRRARRGSSVLRKTDTSLLQRGLTGGKAGVKVRARQPLSARLARNQAVAQE